MSKQNLFLVIIIVIVLAGTALLYSAFQLGVLGGVHDFASCVAAGNQAILTFPEQCQASGKTYVQEVDPNEQAVRNLVTNFGTKLQDVSISAPKKTAAKEISTNYTSFVMPTLLSEWTTDPSKAPGRLTSSPWPDHIQIKSVASTSDSSYTIPLSVIEFANAAGGPRFVSQYDATATLGLVNGQWLITSWEDNLKR